jgi:hypothetical protein
MSISVIFLISTLIVSVSLLALSVYFNIKHAIIILNTQDSIERCLDILDIQYRKMKDITEIPVFFDSVEVRQVIIQIKKSHDAILAVANTLTSSVDINSHETKNDD